ncbi:MAG: DUF493 domain-containing protein [Deferribacteres bacterium]|nr:DUF493 domain-containing protein [candidate division KSB1 bacterium]MCB9503027.1 DUF493 domain-containing protein [Deferribacteres bacterium]
MRDLNNLNNSLEIEYPCLWKFKLIGKHAEALRDAVEIVINKENFLLSRSNKSSRGNYTSFDLSVQVMDEEHRQDVYNRLKNISEIAIIL